MLNPHNWFIIFLHLSPVTLHGVCLFVCFLSFLIFFFFFLFEKERAVFLNSLGPVVSGADLCSGIWNQMVKIGTATHHSLLWDLFSSLKWKWNRPYFWEGGEDYELIWIGSVSNSAGYRINSHKHKLLCLGQEKKGCGKRCIKMGGHRVIGDS